MGRDSKLNPTSSIWDWMVDDLRFYLKKSGMSGAGLARVLKRDPSGVSNLLDGRRKLQLRDAEILDKLWDLNGKFARQLIYAKQRNNKEWFGEFVEYEAVARVIRTFEGMSVPGLLQVPAYSHALATAVGTADPDGLVRRRMARQKIFDKPKPPSLWAIVTESVLDWPIGGPEVMGEQLAHLLDMAKRPNIGIRVIPRDAGAHAGVDGSFTLIYGETNVAYTESPGGGRLVPSEPEVLEYSDRYDRVGQSACSEKQSLSMIERIAEDLK